MGDYTWTIHCGHYYSHISRSGGGGFRYGTFVGSTLTCRIGVSHCYSHISRSGYFRYGTFVEEYT